MLMFLLLISTGCDINIPGCGKRSLPFFNPIDQNTVSANNLPMNNNVLPNNPAANPQDTSNFSVNSKVLVKPLIPTPIPNDIEKIAYTTMEEGQPTLWTMNTDGTERTRLTTIG